MQGGNKARQVYVFLFKVLLWLPLCYVLWYWVLAPLITSTSAWISMHLLKALYPTVIDRFFSQDGYATLITLLPAKESYSGESDVVAVQFNVLKYSFGLPLFLSLSMAIARPGRFEKMLFGGFILMLPVVWGMIAESLKILVFSFPEYFMPIAKLSPWQLEGVALSFQLGSLLLPLLLPVILFLAFDAKYFNNLADSREDTRK
jgi:hypothetical protein